MPASTMVANCRVKSTRSVSLMEEIFLRLEAALFCEMVRTIKPRLINEVMAFSSLSASWRPPMILPWLSRAWYA